MIEKLYKHLYSEIKPIINNPKIVDNWPVYNVHHIDDVWPLFFPVEDFIRSNPEVLPAINAIKNRLQSVNGISWEGDGTLTWLWLPPFCFQNTACYGEFIWHVKQSNNGTSFILSPRLLDSTSIDYEWAEIGDSIRVNC